jgi:hypothetical protein
MKYTKQIDGWENFTLVEQDTPGIVIITKKSGLYTKNLMNCMCLILTDDEQGKYGMLHISPLHADTQLWVSSLREQVGATTAIVTGGNSDTQSETRRNELVSLLQDLTVVVDETKSHWVPDILNPVRGARGLDRERVNSVAVSASTGEYALMAALF